MNHYPDFDIEQAQALSFVMGCSIAQKAFSDPPFPDYANMIRKLIEEADRLADSCHMPEFTNHALPHICSIVQRASIWGSTDGWVQSITPQEAGYLLMALIVHDFGMLSQDAQDLPDSMLLSSRKGMSDLSTWVRSTHVPRLPKLIRRILKEYRERSSELDQHLDIIIHIAASHSLWPWMDGYGHDSKQAEALGLQEARLRGLNAVVAVTDLLDEDSNRCDSATLIRHRHGSTVNVAHWLRHALTAQVRDIKNQTAQVQFRKFPSPPRDFDIVYRVLRNHYRLVLLYRADLRMINAEIRQIVFHEELCEDTISNEMEVWTELADFKYCLTPRLLSIFEPEAKNELKMTSEGYHRLQGIGIETMDLSPYHDFLSPDIPRTDEERVLLYILQRNELLG